MFPSKQKQFPFESEPSRRSFFRWATGAYGLAWAALAAVSGLWSVALVRFFFPSAKDEKDRTFKAGFPRDLPPGSVVTAFQERYQTWIVSHASGERVKIIALRAVCTHLGCMTLWNESERRFKCPCHGSGFSTDGINREGPAPRPLDRFAIRLAEDGQVEIDRSVLYLSRPGREEPGSFVEVEIGSLPIV